MSDSFVPLVERVSNMLYSAGYVILQAGGSALDAVEASVRILESSRWFNAGKGSTANEEGYVHIDIAIY
jgi:beta-aspartyl-peptidase (threonine type)